MEKQDPANRGLKLVVFLSSFVRVFEVEKQDPTNRGLKQCLCDNICGKSKRGKARPD